MVGHNDGTEDAPTATRLALATAMPGSTPSMEGPRGCRRRWHCRRGQGLAHHHRPHEGRRGSHGRCSCWCGTRRWGGRRADFTCNLIAGRGPRDEDGAGQGRRRQHRRSALPWAATTSFRRLPVAPGRHRPGRCRRKDRLPLDHGLFVRCRQTCTDLLQRHIDRVQESVPPRRPGWLSGDRKVASLDAGHERSPRVRREAQVRSGRGLTVPDGNDVGEESWGRLYAVAAVPTRVGTLAPWGRAQIVGGGHGRCALPSRSQGMSFARSSCE